jgi:hypothetical protein
VPERYPDPTPNKDRSCKILVKLYMEEQDRRLALTSMSMS